jgi:DNA-3-methyladenine glycosylase I
MSRFGSPCHGGAGIETVAEKFKEMLKAGYVSTKERKRRRSKSMKVSKIRCEWGTLDPLYLEYHDREWGVPVHDDRHLFEMLVLEGAQAGLSWLTVLRKREAFRKAFDNFDPPKVSRYSEKRVENLLHDSGIIRNRLKIEAAIKNARAFLQVKKEFGSFDRYIWQFVNQRPMQHRWTRLKDIPAKTPESDAMSKDLKKRGFSFVGSTICYAFMQAVGMVNDHVVTCFRYEELHGARTRKNPTRH